MLVTQSGSCVLNGKITLKNVHIVSTIKYNMISISKLTTELKLNIAFTDNGCYIQDMKRQKTLWIGEAKEGLYYFKGN